MLTIEPCGGECGFDDVHGGCYDFCGTCFAAAPAEGEEEEGAEPPKECGADIPAKFLEGEETGEDACNAKCSGC